MNAAARERSTSAFAYRGTGALALAALDLALFVVCALAAEAAYYRTINVVTLTEYFVLGPVVFVVLWMFLFERIGLYRVSFAMTVRDEVYVVATAIVLGIVPQLVLFTAVPTLTGSRLVLIFAAIFAVLLVGGGRAALHAARERAATRTPRRVAIAAESSETAGIGAALELGPDASVFAVPTPLEQTADVDALVDRCSALACRTVYLTSIPPPTVMTRLIERARAVQIEVAIAPAALRGGAYRFAVSTVGRQTVLTACPLRVRTAYAGIAKRLVDMVVGSTVLILASPIMLLASLAILIETGAPILYRQRRIGLDGIPFEMLKFRSMYTGHRGGNMWATRGDARVTRVGAFLRRFSIDELPQMINVLRGEMSVVGPRPEVPEYVERFEREIPRYADRHLVKPGITGWSQLYLDRLLTPDDAPDVLRHDLFYVEHWGMFMDLSIVAKTAAEFLFHRAP